MGGGIDMPEAAERAGSEPPLIAGAIHGVRTWSVLWSDEGEVGLGGFGNARWEPGGSATHAECPDRAERGHKPPSPSCSCGLYARHPFDADALTPVAAGSE